MASASSPRRRRAEPAAGHLSSSLNSLLPRGVDILIGRSAARVRRHRRLRSHRVRVRPGRVHGGGGEGSLVGASFTTSLELYRSSTATACWSAAGSQVGLASTAQQMSMQASAESLHWAAEWVRNPPAAGRRLCSECRCRCSASRVACGRGSRGGGCAASSCSCCCNDHAARVPSGARSYTVLALRTASRGSALDGPESAYQHGWRRRRRRRPTAYVPARSSDVASRRPPTPRRRAHLRANNGSANLARRASTALRYAPRRAATRRSIAASAGRKRSHYAPLRPRTVNARALPPLAAARAPIDFDRRRPSPAARAICYHGPGSTDIAALEYLLLANGCDATAGRRRGASTARSHREATLGHGLRRRHEPLDGTRRDWVRRCGLLSAVRETMHRIRGDARLGGDAARSDGVARVPAAIRPRLRFYNAPIYEGTMADALGGRVRRSAALSHAADGTPTSFLHVLNATATVDDFVVVKVDIDNGPSSRWSTRSQRCPRQRARRRALLRGALLFRRHPVRLGRARCRPPPHRRRGARADADAARTRHP